LGVATPEATRLISEVPRAGRDRIGAGPGTRSRSGRSGRRSRRVSLQCRMDPAVTPAPARTTGRHWPDPAGRHGSHPRPRGTGPEPPRSSAVPRHDVGGRTPALGGGRLQLRPLREELAGVRLKHLLHTQDHLRMSRPDSFDGAATAAGGSALEATCCRASHSRRQAMGGTRYCRVSG
jgi:hypothetical protein